jgi:hypothetical protein
MAPRNGCVSAGPSRNFLSLHDRLDWKTYSGLSQYLLKPIGNTLKQPKMNTDLIYYMIYEFPLKYLLGNWWIANREDSVSIVRNLFHQIYRSRSKLAVPRRGRGRSGTWCCSWMWLGSLRSQSGSLLSQNQIIRSPFAFEIGNLVRYRGDGDSTTLKTMSEKQFPSLEKHELDQLIKVLRKIGLCFAEGKTVIENRERWQDVSIKERGQTGIPSRTNSLEASHGHFKTKSAGRNRRDWGESNAVLYGQNKWMLELKCLHSDSWVLHCLAIFASHFWDGKLEIDKLLLLCSA